MLELSPSEIIIKAFRTKNTFLKRIVHIILHILSSPKRTGLAAILLFDVLEFSEEFVEVKSLSFKS